MDIRTLLVCSLALMALHTVVLLLTRLGQREMVGTGWLAGAFASAALGAALGAARDRVPDAWSIVAGTGFIMLGYLLLHRAVAEFVGRGRHDLTVGIVLLVGLLAGAAYFTYGRPDTRLRIAAVSLAYAVQVGLTARLLLRNGSDHGTRTAECFLGVVLAVLAFLNALRAAVTLWHGAPADFMRSDAVQTVSLLAFLLLSTSIVFGFIWMASARVHVALHREASLDPLTGLLNRRGFLQTAPVRIRATEEEDRSLLLLFADLDELKRVNDTLGHEAGDRAICEAADVLREVLRASDSIARLGGDEFCALVPVSDPRDAGVILQRLENRIRARNARPGRRYSLGISAAAVAVDPGDGRSLEDLLREVDRSMYVRKQARREASNVPR